MLSFWGQMNLLDAASPIQVEVLLFHDHCMILLISISIFVGFMLMKMIMTKFHAKNLIEYQSLEILWTILPFFMLLWLWLPSLRLLYLMDESSENGITFKAIGHQWYWTYESSLTDDEIQSYMVPDSLLKVGDFRLLEVTSRPSLPFLCDINLLTTSTDVIHSFSLPSMGVKVDSIPGRLNGTGLYAFGPGIYYGQCSEICGASHSFMPICIEFKSYL